MLNTLMLVLLVAYVAERPLAADLTTEPNAVGPCVVTDTVKEIKKSGIFSFRMSLLRRIAYVETEDGKDLPRGGIWNVRKEMFEMTRRQESTTRTNVDNYLINRTNLEFEKWESVKWEENHLNIPLSSGLAASLFISLQEEYIPTSSNISSEALFWVNHYSTDGNVIAFETKVQQLFINCRVKSDIIFVLDSSGSIGYKNYQTVINYYVTNFV